MNDQFGFDEEADEEVDVKRKKLAMKEQVAQAQRRSLLLALSWCVAMQDWENGDGCNKTQECCWDQGGAPP